MRTLRRSAVIVAAAAALTAATGSLVVLAAVGSASSALDAQAARYTTTAASTSSASMHNVPGLAGLTICAARQVTATVSVELDGARPASFQVLVDGGPVAQPGAVRFVPAGTHDSASFTFIQSVGPFEANDHHTFDLQWRSPVGGTVKLERGTVVLAYQKGTHAC
jgi:hypothetical protein